MFTYIQKPSFDFDNFYGLHYFSLCFLNVISTEKVIEDRCNTNQYISFTLMYRLFSFITPKKEKFRQKNLKFFRQYFNQQLELSQNQ